MENITPKQLKRIEKIAKLADEGLDAVTEHLFEIEDRLDEEIPQIKDVIARVKGDPGKDYIITEKDKREIAMLASEEAIESLDYEALKGKPGKDYILTEKDKDSIAKKIKVPVVKEKVVIKEQPIVTNIIREIALQDTPEQLFEKINTSEFKIRSDRLDIEIKNYEDEIATLQNRTQLLVQLTSGLDRRINQINLTPGSGAVDSVNGQTGVVVLDADDIDDASTTHKFVTSADLTKLSNLSGTNTGDVTVTDSAEIDFTLTGQQITASIIAGSIDETKLDASVNASLDLADSALQAANISDTAYDATTWNGVTTIAPSKNAIRDKIDTMDTAIALNTAKVTNATHTGDATGSTALTVVALRGVALDSTVGSPSDGKILVYRSAGSDWVLEDKPAGGSSTSFTLAADTGTPETISDGNTVTIAGGTGIDTVVGATDTVTVNLDSATVASLALADSSVQDLADLGITATASELNVLDGITATTAELNYTDGVTSNIQTQLNAKVSSQWTTNGSNIYYNTGAIGIGGADLSNVKVNITGSQSSANNAFGVYMGGLTLTPSTTYDAYFQYAGGGAIATGASNTIPRGVAFYAAPMTKTGTGTITATYSIYAAVSTSGTANYGAYFQGSVGIGTTAPVRALSVGSGNANDYIRISSDSRNYDIGVGSGISGDDKFTLYDATATAFRLVVDTNGNLGIGTTTPNRKVEIVEPGGQLLRLAYDNTSLANFDFTRNVTTGALSLQGSQTGFNNILLAPTSGYVGIGIAAPTTTLHVKGDVSGGIAMFERTTSATNVTAGVTKAKATSTGDMADGFGTAMQFYIEDDAAVENIIGDIRAIRAGADNTGNLAFSTTNAGVTSTKMLITSGGLVGIGISPTAGLHLAAGNTTTAPFKLTTGTALTTPQDGALEYHASHLYFTIGSTRYQLDQQTGSGGGITRSVNSISSNTTLGSTASTDYTYYCTNTINATLPSATSNTNRYTVVNAGTGVITVVGTISGVTNDVLYSQYETAEYESNGTNWFKIN